MKQPLEVLRGIDLRRVRGRTGRIVGPSGCGKTTFLNAVDGLIRVTGGEILVDGRAVERPGPDRAFVFQNDCLFPWRTVRQNVTYGLEIQGKLSRPKCGARRSLIDLVGLRASPSIIRTSCPAACASASTSRAPW